MSGFDDLSADDAAALRLAELVATGGPVFELWRVSVDARTLVLSQFDQTGIRHLVTLEHEVVVHGGDRAAATQAVEQLAGPDLEVVETRPVARADDDELDGVELVTVYTAGDLVTAEVIKARLGAEGVPAVLRYDPTLGMARHLALDATVRVQVPSDDEERARELLGGEDLDHGSSDTSSRAWSTPARRVGATGLLIFVGLWGLGVAVLVLAILSDIFS